ncbi:hypothetical protein A2W54_04185 [Candidatus Giovannonibacteria bacterium RIFCSPHIGHO2_02_43_13]|uniref:Uncharacterized protein n=1 Tax=Candidatus Giovannonibacteria bacterium RIFCSPHIGHO2_02_43_13 TaxID=1798330 RepID=A0A1F5WSN6_9BACT|nr:MAG: hypothetical protein A3E06_02320 [Candidatus Giovannonibacteria bacterium RIFCSPHIGHO2_12_FULL_44_42]OGF78637.1 MAG: hypothetical protein A2W54_04185 [Candidatus Giovannonibacteria bacterium RIFCSPHIGHO2_02_43_13]
MYIPTSVIVLLIFVWLYFKSTNAEKSDFWEGIKNLGFIAQIIGAILLFLSVPLAIYFLFIGEQLAAFVTILPIMIFGGVSGYKEDKRK